MRLRISFHITKRENEKMPTKADSITSQRFCCITARRTAVKTRTTSAPCSSDGSGSSPSTTMPKFCLSISSSVTFMTGSSSRRRRP